jgi:hypothetical protein
MNEVENEMNGEGRILVRPSGTEPLVLINDCGYFFICAANSLKVLPLDLIIAASCTPVSLLLLNQVVKL